MPQLPHSLNLPYLELLYQYYLSDSATAGSESSEFFSAVSMNGAAQDSVQEEEPQKYFAVMTKARRRGKIFIDYLRNGWAATAVAAFSSRARAGAPVSAPLFWYGLDSCRGDSFNVKNISARLQGLKFDPWAEWESARRPVTSAMRKKLAG